MKNKQTVEISGSRGTKIVKTTGVDPSDYMKGDASFLRNKGMKGGRNNLGHSISGASAGKNSD